MKMKVYFCNLAKYLEGRENGRWLQLPMDPAQLETVFNEIVGEGQEGIILDHTACFEVSEYENIFALNDFMMKLAESGLDEDLVEALFVANPDREYVMKSILEGSFTIINVDGISAEWCPGLSGEQLYGMVLDAAGYNDLFSMPIPDEMIDYVDFKKIYQYLSASNGWMPVKVHNTTYLVSFLN